MDGLRRSISYGAPRESLLGGLRLALIALSHTLKKKKKVPERKWGREQALPFNLSLLGNIIQKDDIIKPRLYLFDNSYLSQVSCCAALYQRNVSCQTHPVHMITGRYGDTKCFILIISTFCHFGETTYLWAVRWREYLCYLEHSSPAQTFWRTPHCSQDWKTRIHNQFHLNRERQTKKRIPILVFHIICN